MSEQTTIPLNHARAVRLWLFAVAALIFGTLIVGGATRLTESGLSITEWKPVTGVLPPLSDEIWREEFRKYQAIPQYKELNRGMSLDQFKTIYWWEWSHRLLARVVGAVFLLPFLFFLWRGMIAPALKWRLWSIFAGGATLGGVGWWMVSSGLTERVSVSQYRLAFHLTLASAIYAAILWTAQQVVPRPEPRAPVRMGYRANTIAALILLQIYLGALVAGLGAGLSFNTWPLIDGALVPSADRLWFLEPWWRNLFENVLTVQFDHRIVAYAIWLLTMFHVVHALIADADRRAKIEALVLGVLITGQVALGIVTLLNVAPLDLSLAHQALAIVVFTFAILHAERLQDRFRLHSLGRMSALRIGGRS